MPAKAGVHHRVFPATERLCATSLTPRKTSPASLSGTPHSGATLRVTKGRRHKAARRDEAQKRRTPESGRAEVTAACSSRTCRGGAAVGCFSLRVSARHSTSPGRAASCSFRRTTFPGAGDVPACPLPRPCPRHAARCPAPQSSRRSSRRGSPSRPQRRADAPPWGSRIGHTRQRTARPLRRKTPQYRRRRHPHPHPLTQRLGTKHATSLSVRPAQHALLAGKTERVRTSTKRKSGCFLRLAWRTLVQASLIRCAAVVSQSGVSLRFARRERYPLDVTLFWKRKERVMQSFLSYIYVSICGCVSDCGLLVFICLCIFLSFFFCFVLMILKTFGRGVCM